MAKYRLLKDYPHISHARGTTAYVASKKIETIKAGAVFIKLKTSCDYINSDCSMRLSPDMVEKSPDWFEKIEEEEFTVSDMILFTAYVKAKGGGWMSGFKVTEADVRNWQVEKNPSNFDTAYPSEGYF